MTYRPTLITFTMLMIVGWAAWTTFLSYRPEAPTTAKDSNLPDAFMEDITTTIMDKLGKPSLKIVTPKMTHYKQDDITQLESPQLTLYRQSPKPWFINAKFAKAIHGVDTVYFWDNVLIHHAADESNPATLIKTSTLTVYPNKKIAETAKAITMIQPNIVITAVGMYADLNTGNIKLLSQSRGEYVPNN